MIPGVGPYSTLITPKAGSLFHAVFQLLRPMPRFSARKRTRHPRYAAAMTNKKIIDRLNQIAALYDELAAGQDPGPTDRE